MRTIMDFLASELMWRLTIFILGIAVGINLARSTDVLWPYFVVAIVAAVALNYARWWKRERL